MKKAAALPAIALLLLTGCSTADAAAETPAVSSSPAAAQTSAAAAVQDSEEGTCLKLLKANGKGPLYSIIHVFKIGGGTTTFTSTPEGTRLLADEFQGIIRNAPEDMVAALEILASPAEGTLQRAENSDVAFIASTGAWQSAVGELLTRCAPYETSTADVEATDGSTTAYPGVPWWSTWSRWTTGSPPGSATGLLRARLLPWLRDCTHPTTQTFLTCRPTTWQPE